MGSGDTLRFDTGEYLHVLNLNMRQSPRRSIRYCIRPAALGYRTDARRRSATIDRMNPYAGRSRSTCATRRACR